MWDAWQEQTALTAARKVLRKNRSPQAAAQAVLEAAGSVRKAGSADAIVAISIPEPLPKCEPAIALEPSFKRRCPGSRFVSFFART